MHNPENYECNLAEVKSKTDAALLLMKKSMIYLQEAASGGEHDTGNFSDKFDDRINKLFDEVMHELNVATCKLKSLKTQINTLK